MKKWKITLLIFLILLPQIVLSIDMCTDSPPPNTLCTFRTPSINCTSYNYTLFLNNGSIQLQDNLTIYNNNIYQFNFSQAAGDYIIELCDETIREVFVGGNEKNMAWIAIIMAIGLMTAFIGIAAFKIEEKELLPIKMTFFILFIINSLMLGIFSYIISVNPADATSFAPLGLAYAFINVFVIMGFMYNYGFKVLAKIFKKGGDRFTNSFK